MQPSSPARQAPAEFAFKFLYVAAFITGLASLAIEFAASRLVASVFSASNIVWAGVVGMTLFYLMLGYFIGGRWADRSTTPATCYRIMAWAALGISLLPVTALPILRAAAKALETFDLGMAMLAAAGIALLFIIPVTLLGCVPPFIVRLSVRRVSKSGQVAGLIYALSTAGGLTGVFITVLWLIPLLGTPATFALNACVLMLAALLGIWSAEKKLGWRYVGLVVVLAVAIGLGLRRPLKPPPPNTTLLYEKETAYNYIQVVETANQSRYLLLNETLAVHSIYHPSQLETNGSWDYYVAAPYFNAPPYAPERVRKVAVLGLAAGTVARQFTSVYGPVQIDGVEIDPGVVEAGRRYFDMNMPNLKVIVEDARFALTRLDTDYQVISIDAYRPPYIPWQLTTQEFFTEVRAHLAPDGVVMINVGRTNSDRRLVEAMTATLQQVFPTVHTLDVPAAFNTMLAATRQPTRAENLTLNFRAANPAPDSFLAHAMQLAARSLKPTVASNLIFTDDRAQVEFLADSLVLRYALEGGTVQFSAPQTP